MVNILDGGFVYTYFIKYHAILSSLLILEYVMVDSYLVKSLSGFI